MIAQTVMGKRLAGLSCAVSLASTGRCPSNQHNNCLLPLPVTQEEDGENHDNYDY
jgi:hypothetical protein